MGKIRLLQLTKQISSAKLENPLTSSRSIKWSASCKKIKIVEVIFNLKIVIFSHLWSSTSTEIPLIGEHCSGDNDNWRGRCVASIIWTFGHQYQETTLTLKFFKLHCRLVNLLTGEEGKGEREGGQGSILWPTRHGKTCWGGQTLHVDFPARSDRSLLTTNRYGYFAPSCQISVSCTRWCCFPTPRDYFVQFEKLESVSWLKSSTSQMKVQ